VGLSGSRPTNSRNYMPRLFLQIILNYSKYFVSLEADVLWAKACNEKI
jgi:hypothetical protein